MIAVTKIAETWTEFGTRLGQYKFITAQFRPVLYTRSGSKKPHRRKPLLKQNGGRKESNTHPLISTE